MKRLTPALVITALFFNPPLFANCESQLNICNVQVEELKGKVMQANDDALDAKRRMVANKGSSLNTVLGIAFVSVVAGILLGAEIVKGTRR